MTFDPTFHADAILRAAGSRLANYTMPGSRDAIIDAVMDIFNAGYDAALIGMPCKGEPISAPPPKP